MLPSIRFAYDFRVFAYASMRRFAVLGSILFAIGCRSVPACPETSVHLATKVYGGSEGFWFDGTIVHTSYHMSSIAPVPRYVSGPVIDRIALRNAGSAREVHIHVSETSFRGRSPRARSWSRAMRPGTSSPRRYRRPSTAATRSCSRSPRPGWSAFTSGAETVDIAVTNGLRAQGWGSTVAARPPTWAVQLYELEPPTDEIPLRRRESVAYLESRFTDSLAASPAGTELYAIGDLYLAGANESIAPLHFDFHALPFREPASGLVFARARWLDPATAQFLTPAPYGYQDSSNLYAAFAGNPVNFRDPEGTEAFNLLDDVLEVGARKLDDAAEWVERKLGRGAEELAEHTDDAAKQAEKHGDDVDNVANKADNLDNAANATRRALSENSESAMRRLGGAGGGKKAATRASGQKIGKSNVLADAAEKSARYGGARQRDILLKQIKNAPKAERKGLVHAFREMHKRGYLLEDVSIKYKGQHGPDMVFSRNGRYAIVEAKSGKGLGWLKKDVSGLRQGSAAYNISRLRRDLQYGNGQYDKLARQLIKDIASGRVRSFGTFYRSRKIYELPVGWPGSAKALVR